MSKIGHTEFVIERVQRYIRELRLIQPGERIAIAVSGGADSVALLRALLELRSELGAVLSVAHFNHKIRGDEADADEQFVKELSIKFELEFLSSFADAPAYSREHKLSLETAARELRQTWFGRLVQERRIDKVATAHTLDDQAETVLMRLLRGTGGRGLAGIAPLQKEKCLIRPLLATTRREVEDYLHSLRQAWREDSSNKDLHHTRNRIRRELLPFLESNYNPALRQNLADLAEVARAEEEYWEKEISGLVSRLVQFGKPSRSGRSNTQEGSNVLALDQADFRGLPVSIQRRLLRALAEKFGIGLEFQHVEQLRALTRQKKAGKDLRLPGGLMATSSLRELHLGRREHQPSPADYCYRLGVPGEVTIPELGTQIRAQLISAGNAVSGYNSALLLDRARLAPELKVRNWRPGDRFFPAHTRSPKKVKELLQSVRIGHELSPGERKSWPVVESAGEIVWMRGFPVPEAFVARSDQGIVIEETKLGSEAEQ